MSETSDTLSGARAVRIAAGEATLEGDLAVPARRGGDSAPERSRPEAARPDRRAPAAATGVVLFAHGSGSSRKSQRNRYVAGVLQGEGLATLLLDQLTREEESIDVATARLRFDIPFLAQRLLHATEWLRGEPETSSLPIGYFGASTGAGAALVATAEMPDQVRAVVSRGGRPDLAAAALPDVKAPTLLIVGGDDVPLLGMNRAAMARMTAEVRLEIVPEATHLFEEPGTLERVADLARDWFHTHLR